MAAVISQDGAETQTVAATGGLYRRLWRWHFYAAFLVIPFVLLQSITGTLYLWHEEWADWAHPDLRFAPPGDTPVSLERQLAAARAAPPESEATRVIVPDDPRRSTQVMFAQPRANGGEPLPFPVFVDPYSGEVLGSISPWAWMPGWTREVHGGWPLGDAGSWLLELGASWAVVMILSGLYLWWPRDRRFIAALLPRFTYGARVLVRDLHACVAVWFSMILLVFLVTALPWTSFWGKNLLEPLQDALGQRSPFAATSRARSTVLPGVEALSLDQAVARARAAGVRGALEVTLGKSPDAAWSLRNRQPRAAQETSLALDRYSGNELARTTWADYPPIPKAVAIGVDLHEGTYFGRANQWLNTIVALALVWMSATGFASWWLRRPRGRLGAPLRSDIELPRGLGIAGLGLCLLLPLLGASVLGLWLADALLGRLR